MCGVFAALLHHREVVPVLLESLKLLEYRGYDSAGIAAIHSEGIRVIKSVGDIDSLISEHDPLEIKSRVGMGHTRWATHGKPTKANAHPHQCGQISVIHNGIIENHESLRVWCQSQGGYQLHSETDTEVIACLIEYRVRVKGMSMLSAIDDICRHLDGQYAFLCLSSQFPDEIFGVSHGRPLLYGRSDEGIYVSSDLNTLARWSNVYTQIPEDEPFCCSLSQGFRLTDEAIQLMLTAHNTRASDVSLDGHETYMMKEIMEQPERLEYQAQLYQYDKDMYEAAKIISQSKYIHIIACGSSYHAACVARYWYERWLKKPCMIEIASEYRYREPVILDSTCIIVISQSGETADTIAATGYAKGSGIENVIAFCNVPTSYLAQHSTVTIPLNVGIEMGVASTKAFTGQLFALLSLGRIASGAYWLPSDMNDMVTSAKMIIDEAEVWQDIGSYLSNFEHVIYVGRDHLYPIAMEGALKMKEISYIHAEAYAAGELKHGPLALIDQQHPTVALVDHFMKPKINANIDEIKAREGHVIHVDISKMIGRVLMSHQYQRSLYSILTCIPLQFIAYYTASKKDCNIDKPRNLAKCVTVE